MLSIENDSLAELLDVVRQNIIEAWDLGKDPMYVALNPDSYQAVMNCKEAEYEKGYTVLIMGLEVTCSDEVLFGEAKVF